MRKDAGRYVPYISAAILDEKDETYYDLKGAMVYDPCIGQFDYVQEQVPTYDFIKDHADLFNFDDDFMSQLEDMHSSCGYKAYQDKYYAFPPAGVQPTVQTKSNCNIFNMAASQAQQVNECFNIYEVNQTCPTPQDPMADNMFDSSNGKTNYFNRDDVKKALHAPAATQWSECSNNAVFVGRGGPEGEGDLSMDSIVKVLPQVIEATNRTLVINGDLDMIIITNGTLMAIQNMTYNGDMGFQEAPSTPINIDGLGEAGRYHIERGLLWGETYNSGHMGPEYQPAVAFKHLQWMRGVIDQL
jgi:carboxypeptidase D